VTWMQTRRKFLNLGWKVGGSLLGVAAGWTVFESLRPLASNTSGGPITLGAPTNFATDSATYFSSGRLYVTSVQGQTFALSQKCPHLGCRVPYCESSGRFECACHGSVFDLGGEWIQGPAPRGMDHFAITVDANGVLVANTSVLLTGPDHGADQFATPPKGPSCLEKG
jgi:nitrite reductase/ring-hydroxylating ferredoxin subunit